MKFIDELLSRIFEVVLNDDIRCMAVNKREISAEAWYEPDKGTFLILDGHGIFFLSATIVINESYHRHHHHRIVDGLRV